MASITPTKRDYPLDYFISIFQILICCYSPTDESKMVYDQFKQGYPKPKTQSTYDNLQ